MRKREKIFRYQQREERGKRKPLRLPESEKGRKVLQPPEVSKRGTGLLRPRGKGVTDRPRRDSEEERKIVSNSKADGMAWHLI